MTTAEERLLYPKPGSKIAEARDYGVDLTLLVNRLRLTPEERLRDLQSMMNFVEKFRGIARKSNDRLRNGPDRPR